MTTEDVERASRTSVRPSALGCAGRLVDAGILVVAVVDAIHVGGFLVAGPLLGW